MIPHAVGEHLHKKVDCKLNILLLILAFVLPLYVIEICDLDLDVYASLNLDGLSIL